MIMCLSPFFPFSLRHWSRTMPLENDRPIVIDPGREFTTKAWLSPVPDEQPEEAPFSGLTVGPRAGTIIILQLGLGKSQAAQVNALLLRLDLGELHCLAQRQLSECCRASGPGPSRNRDHQHCEAEDQDMSLPTRRHDHFHQKGSRSLGPSGPFSPTLGARRYAACPSPFTSARSSATLSLRKAPAPCLSPNQKRARARGFHVGGTGAGSAAGAADAKVDSMSRAWFSWSFAVLAVSRAFSG
jgi:hypothetical protein